MYRLIFIAVLSIYLTTIVEPQVLFTGNELIYHTNKNYTDFEFGLNSITTVLGNLQKLLKTFTEQNTTVNKRLVRRGNQCLTELSRKKDHVHDVFKSITRKHRNKRSLGLDFIGEAFSFVTSVPSPSAWQREKILVNKLSDIISGEGKEIHSLTTAFEKKVLPEIDLIEENERILNNKLAIFYNIIDRFLKIDSICNEVNSVLEEYELEIMNLLAIKEAADFGKISDRIFSLDLLKVKIVSIAAGLGYKYTANILTAKSTGFTCVPFSPVLPLSFWQPMTVGNEPLYFDCSLIFTPISKAF